MAATPALARLPLRIPHWISIADRLVKFCQPLDRAPRASDFAPPHQLPHSPGAWQAAIPLRSFADQLGRSAGRVAAIATTTMLAPQRLLSIKLWSSVV